MKPVSEQELEALVGEARLLVGSPLQEVVLVGRDLALGHWTSEGLKWLWLDLNSVCPLMMVFPSWPQGFKKKSETKPIRLFLRAHGLNRPLTRVVRDQSLGRVVRLTWGGDFHLEFRSIPRAVNLILQNAEGKKISWSKLRPLGAQRKEASPAPESPLFRSPQEIQAQWRAKSVPSSPKGKSPAAPSSLAELRRRLNLVLQKKRRALERVEVALTEQKESPWRSLGKWLLQHQQESFSRLKELPEDWVHRLKVESGLAWNIENCFQRAKEQEAKLQGTQHRKEQLIEEVRQLQALMQEGVEVSALESALASHQKPAGSRTPSRKDQVRSASKSSPRLRCRKLSWGNGQEFLVGLSARDNLQLLKQARAWDFWFHLKDRPGAHGILRRERHQEVSEARLHEAGHFLLSVQLGSQLKPGEVWALTVAERRFVQPIKGDRLGRVQFRNERSLVVKT